MKILFLILICFSTYAGLACSCEGQNDVQTEYNSVDFVLIGKITSVDTLFLVNSNQIKNPPDPRIVHELNRPTIPVLKFSVQVLRKFKGTLTTNTIDVYTGFSGASCGVRF
ncbi:MAG: hypothetical protein KDD29_05495 [Flavobacteriales bacterium]|nr:hypothetical protein [Flavobacteriales bacterium]